MNLLRKYIENWYDKNKEKLFDETENDPEVAHEKFVKQERLIDKLGLSKFLLNNDANYTKSNIGLSNAAGFNKNGTIPPIFLWHLGFDRVVIGTVTHDAYQGNPRPRIKRFSETESLVNWMGLPGVGSKQVAKNLEYFGDHGVPLTINLMSTPGKTGQDLLNDLEGTIRDLREASFVDRWEF